MLIIKHAGASASGMGPGLYETQRRRRRRRTQIQLQGLDLPTVSFLDANSADRDSPLHFHCYLLAGHPAKLSLRPSRT